MQKADPVYHPIFPDFWGVGRAVRPAPLNTPLVVILLLFFVCVCQTKSLSVSNKETTDDVVRRCLTEFHIEVRSLTFTIYTVLH